MDTLLATNSLVSLDVLGLFLLLAGLIIGLGAVTVIDVHGFLGRHNPYWTEAAIRTHKVTKPLIWIGIILGIVGGFIFYRNESYSQLPIWQLCIALLLIANGLFLSFWVSPKLLERERDGHADELLPASWQRAMTASFIISFAGWWGNVLLLVLYLLGAR